MVCVSFYSQAELCLMIVSQGNAFYFWALLISDVLGYTETLCNLSDILSDEAGILRRTFQLLLVISCWNDWRIWCLLKEPVMSHQTLGHFTLTGHFAILRRLSSDILKNQQTWQTWLMDFGKPECFYIRMVSCEMFNWNQSSKWENCEGKKIWKPFQALWKYILVPLLNYTGSLVARGGWTRNRSMYELFLWFGIADSLKLLKPSGAGVASLGILSNSTWCTKIAQGCQPGTRLILNHDTIPYLKIKRNFIHTLFWGTPPLFWGSGYQTKGAHQTWVQSLRLRSWSKAEAFIKSRSWSRSFDFLEARSLCPVIEPKCPIHVFRSKL